MQTKQSVCNIAKAVSRWKFIVINSGQGQEKMIKKLKLGMATRVYNPSMQEHGGVEAKRFQI